MATLRIQHLLKSVGTSDILPTGTNGPEYTERGHIH